MNKTSNTSSVNVFGAFARSGFFKKSPAVKSASAEIVRPKYYEAATAAQAARLSEVLGRGMSSHLRF
ncbi:MAG: hypothetical protein ABW223_09965 [Rariglobus sp.]